MGLSVTIVRQRRRNAGVLLLCVLIIGLENTARLFAGETSGDRPANALPEEAAHAALESFRKKAGSFSAVHYVVHGTQTIPPGPEALLYEGHPPKDTVTIEMWKKGSARRQDTTLSSGEHVVLIERPDGRYASDPASGLYTRSETETQQAIPPWVSCQPLETSDTAKILRKETVEGSAVTVVAQTVADGPATVKTWVRDDTGFAVRSETVMSLNGSSVLMIAECGDFSFEEMPDSLFAVDAGRLSTEDRAGSR